MSEFVADPKPASTVVVMRDAAGGDAGNAAPDVFMVRRHERTAFMGGAQVFPGGRVDTDDADGDESWCDGLDHAVKQLAGTSRPEAIAYHVAAARELFEEAGVLLARAGSGSFVSLGDADAHARFRQYRFDVHSHTSTFAGVVRRERLRLALDALVLFAHWVTPPIDTRQFDTRFFLTRVPPEQTPAHDEKETTDSTWVTASAAIAQADAGAIVLPPPTWTSLRELEPFRTVDDAIAWARGRQVTRRQPKMIDGDGVRMLVIPGDPLHPEPATGDVPRETRFVTVDRRRWRAERGRT
ncbi:MAG TPA: NUDIX hydrolase [Vicinamibacterales bacterium]|nr:NUDIX hydrolase [Vicinamibacterales bacterium]